METILVVEDDALVRRSVTTQIQSLGYQTISVGSGAEALAVVERGDSFDLLFTDMIRPRACRRGAQASAGNESSVPVRLYRRRHLPSRPARSRRAAPRQALQQGRNCPHDPPCVDGWVRRAPLPLTSSPSSGAAPPTIRGTADTRRHCIGRPPHR